MAKYSIALNIFLPQTIVAKLQEVTLPEYIIFDWREVDLYHCTVKTIAVCDNIPVKNILDGWIAMIQKEIATQKSFRMKIDGVATFPTAIFAKIFSPALVRIHKKLCAVLPSSQLQFESEHYVPHVSLGKVNKEISVDEKKQTYFGTFDVKEMQLMIWDLNNLRNVTIYHTFYL